MSWTTVRMASFGPLMTSLWRGQRAQHMTQSLMMNGPPLNLSSPYLPSENSAGDRFELTDPAFDLKPVFFFCCVVRNLTKLSLVNIYLVFFSLCRYGFDRERGKQALESGGGDFGATLEQLLHKIFSERYGQKALSPDGLEGVPMDECLSQRQEEALALTAIYGERFSERIANAVWTVTLDLLFLSNNAAKDGRGDRSRGGGGAVNIRDVCRFYMKGQGCRFGDKCKYKHQLPTKGRSGAGSPDLTGPSQPGFSSYSPPEYELEIRFPKGNRYPFQAPIVAFSTTDESFGAAGRLSVTERLFGEALAAATSNEPVVYTLITLCEDEDTMKELLAVSHHKYSTPPPVVVPLPPPSLAKSKSVRSNASEESRSSSTNSSNHTNSRRTAPPTNQRPTDRESLFTLFIVPIFTTSVLYYLSLIPPLSLKLKRQERQRSWMRGMRMTRMRLSQSRVRVTSI